MVIHRIKLVKRPVPGSMITTYWVRIEGWYLFGFIPLYVRQCNYAEPMR